MTNDKITRRIPMDIAEKCVREKLNIPDEENIDIENYFLTGAGVSLIVCSVLFYIILSSI